MEIKEGPVVFQRMCGACGWTLRRHTPGCAFRPLTAMDRVAKRAEEAIHFDLLTEMFFCIFVNDKSMIGVWPTVTTTRPFHHVPSYAIGGWRREVGVW